MVIHLEVFKEKILNAFHQPFIIGPALVIILTF